MCSTHLCKSWKFDSHKYGFSQYEYFALPFDIDCHGISQEELEDVTSVRNQGILSAYTNDREKWVKGDVWMDLSVTET